LFEASPLMRQIFGYLLTYALSKYGVICHGGCIMGNHLHLVVTDVHGCLGLFMSTFHGLTARAINHHWGLARAFVWDGRPPAVQEIVCIQDHLDEFTYVAGNPTAAGLVFTAGDYEGFVITPDQIGQTLVFERPEGFFNTGRGAHMPDSVELTVHEPIGAEALYGVGGFAKHAAKKLADYEAKRRFYRTYGEAYERRRRQVRASVEDVPSVRMPMTAPLKEIICSDNELRKQKIAELRDFRDAHARAVNKLVAGGNPEFPYGTYARRLWGGVRVGPPPGDLAAAA